MGLWVLPARSSSRQPGTPSVSGSLTALQAACRAAGKEGNVGFPTAVESA